jgi:DNA polymerase-1
MDNSSLSPAVMRVIFALQSKGKRTERQGEGWLCQCPAHDDTHPSFAVDGDPVDGKALLHCRAGCTQNSVVEALGIRPTELFLTPQEQAAWQGRGVDHRGTDSFTSSDGINSNQSHHLTSELGADLKREHRSDGAGNSSPPPEDSTGEGIGLTLEQYADAKRMPKEFLQRLGLSTVYVGGLPVVSIPYKDREGTVRAVQFRQALHKGAREDGRFRWSRKGTTPLLYGLWRTEALSPAKDIILPEGASDCHTLWNHDLPALGLPGANSWREEWAKELDRYERIFIVLEDDQGGDAVEQWVAASSIRHRVWFITLGRFKDPSGLYLDSPGLFHERWAYAVEHATSWAEAYRAKQLKEVAALYRDIKPLLEAPDLLDRLRHAMQEMGYVGDAWAPLLTYLILTSRLLDRPMNGAIIGPPSVGKNVVVDVARELLPSEEFHAVDASSPLALIYDDADLRHKAVLVGELDSLPDDGPAGSAIRSLAHNNQTTYDVVEKDPKAGKFRTRRICREGPTVLLTTGIKSPAWQLQTRMLEIHLHDDPDVTFAIIERQAEEHEVEELPKPDVQRWRNLQKWLALQPTRVRIPFAKALAKALRARVKQAPTRLRRDHPKLLACIEVIALLYQLQRRRTSRGAVVATLDDYEHARQLLEPVFGHIATDGVTPAIRQTVAGVASLLGVDPPADKTVSESALARQLQLSKTATQYRVRRCLAGGWLVNHEPRKGYAAKLTLGAPLPEETPILPTVDDIEGYWHGPTPPSSPPPPDDAPPTASPPCVGQFVTHAIPMENADGVPAAERALTSDEILVHPLVHQVTDAVSLEIERRTSELMTPPAIHPPPLSSDESDRASDSRQPSAELLPSPSVEVGASYDGLSYIYLSDAAQVERALPDILAAKTLGIDTETTGLDPLMDTLRLVQVATPDQVYVVDAIRCPVEMLAPILEGNRWLIAQNLKFDFEMLIRAGLPWPTAKLLDTQLSAQVLSAGKAIASTGAHTLEALVETYVGQKLDKTQQTSDWGQAVLSHEQLQYAARDAHVLLPLAEALTYELREERLWETAKLESACAMAFAWMELSGLPVDTVLWGAQADQQSRRADACRQKLTAFTGQAVNWNSWQQVLPILRDRGITVDSTKNEVLISYVSDELVATLLEYRQASKAAGTYGLTWLEHVHPRTGRIHSDFFQLGTAVGRSSARHPNVQNLPRDVAYRTAIRASEGRVLIKADYSQLHLRIVAAMAPDVQMQEAFQQGADLHRRTAAGLLKKDTSAVTSEDRQLAKALNFGLIYSMGAPRLQKQAWTDYGVRLTEQEARSHKQAWFNLYPGIRKWHDREQYAIARDQLTETRSYQGRRRMGITYLPDRLSSPVLGTEADGMKAAMVALFTHRTEFPSVRLVNCIHDELLVECDRQEATAVASWVQHHMEAAMQEAVKGKTVTPVEVHIGRSWAGEEA